MKSECTQHIHWHEVHWRFTTNPWNGFLANVRPNYDDSIHYWYEPCVLSWTNLRGNFNTKTLKLFKFWWNLKPFKAISLSRLLKKKRQFFLKANRWSLRFKPISDGVQTEGRMITAASYNSHQSHKKSLSLILVTVTRP